jgi:hypothetical protein
MGSEEINSENYTLNLIKLMIEIIKGQILNKIKIKIKRVEVCGKE